MTVATLMSGIRHLKEKSFQCSVKAFYLNFVLLQIRKFFGEIVAWQVKGQGTRN